MMKMNGPKGAMLVSKQGPRGLPTENEVDINKALARRDMKKPPIKNVGAGGAAGAGASKALVGAALGIAIAAILALIIYVIISEISSCSLGGSGVDPSSCTCNPGYTESLDGRCLDDDECVTGSDNCEQVCENTEGGYTCTCWEGYSMVSATCLDIDECAADNGGCSEICENSIGSYNCSCNSGMELLNNEHTCADINECRENNGGCSDDCNNFWGGYECLCGEGYRVKPDQRTCEVDPNYVPDCRLAGSFLDVDTCTCHDGFTPNSAGTYCVDLNECSSGDSRCQHQCSNSFGSYACSCDGGYTLQSNGWSCTDVDECEAGISECPSFCVNTYGGYICQCPDGKVYDETIYDCVDIDECATDNGGCTGECFNTDGTFYCVCPVGYQVAGDGFTCLDIDECYYSSGGCSYACLNHDGWFECICPEGEQIDITNNNTCIDINECSPEYIFGSCSDMCINSYGSYECQPCDSGYYVNDTTHSECYDINECEGDHGCPDVCINQEGTYSCGCTADEIDIYNDNTACATHYSECCDPASRPCELTMNNGYLVSANYPSNYGNNNDCQYKINLAGGTNGVRLEFLTFDTESGYDKIWVYDGADMASTVILNAHSGGDPGAITSTGEHLYLRFDSDGSVTKPGFVGYFYKV